MILNKSLFIFRRDLRLEDNTALNEALKKSQVVIPCFIIDPRQFEPHPYRSDFALRFLVESLKDLQAQLTQAQGKLFIFKGKAEEVVRDLIRTADIDAVMVNTDYTPFSISRDLAIKKIVEEQGKQFCSSGDALLHEPSEIGKPDGSGPYIMYTPFYKRSQMIPVRPVKKLMCHHFYQGHVAGEELQPIDAMIDASIPVSSIKGGRQQALQLLNKMRDFKSYDQRRDFPQLNATTHLSAHHKFGTVSIREVYHTIATQLGHEHTLIRELYWRDFFSHIAHHFPYVFGQSFDQAYDNIAWSTDNQAFQRWCDGNTGFPIVDAGMRELNQTGFMHNRVRMITGSFLVKDLHIDWRLGERYFATKLIDYDPAVNNGNWQWVASTGCDKQPYFRVFNPWLQQLKFDPKCIYIKQWIPELRQYSAKEIHQWHDRLPLFDSASYPSLMVDHAASKEQIIAMFKLCKK